MDNCIYYDFLEENRYRVTFGIFFQNHKTKEYLILERDFTNVA